MANQEKQPLKNFYMEYFENWHKAEALAGKRLDLLKQGEKFRLEKGYACPSCKQKPAYHLDQEKYIDIHTNNCELAKELGNAES